MTCHTEIIQCLNTYQLGVVSGEEERLQRDFKQLTDCLERMCSGFGACPSLRQQVVEVGFGPPQPATWSYHAADCQPTAPVPLVSLVQPAGTLYQTI